MYNCFFGIPNRLNLPNFNTNYRNFLPTPPKNYTCRQTEPEVMACEKTYVTENVDKNKNKIENANANNMSFKHSSYGGMLLPQGTERGATYNVASVNLDTYACRNFSIYFNFTCNIHTVNAQGHLRFQLLKQEKYQSISSPVSSSFTYIIGIPSTETNAFSFSACDCDSTACACCNYSVYIEIMGAETEGSIVISNPILIASIFETCSVNV